MTTNLGTIARAQREKLGLSKLKVADMACCDRRTVRAFELNQRNVTIDTVMSIFSVLGLKLVVVKEEKRDV